jgi:hypothetical protein
MVSSKFDRAASRQYRAFLILITSDIGCAVDLNAALHGEALDNKLG